MFGAKGHNDAERNQKEVSDDSCDESDDIGMIERCSAGRSSDSLCILAFYRAVEPSKYAVGGVGERADASHVGVDAREEARQGRSDCGVETVDIGFNSFCSWVDSS